MSATEKEFRVVAIGTWMYDGAEPREIELYRDTDLSTGESRYHVGASTGSRFSTEREAKDWADRQPWGPVTWCGADHSFMIMVVDDDG